MATGFIVQPYRFAAAGVTPVTFGDAQVAIINSDVVGSATGTFTTDNTDDWVYVSIHYRDASGSGTWTVTAGDVGGGNEQTVTQITQLATAQFSPSMWLGKFKPNATGTRQLNITKTISNWSGVVAVCTRVVDAHATTPDGTPETNTHSAPDATGMTDTISALPGSLLLLFAAPDTGSADPFTPTNGVTERIDTASGTASNDVSAFVGTKAAGAGGSIDVGVNWSATVEWASILHEVRAA